MKLVAQLVVAFWIGGGLVAFSVWAVRLFSTSELKPDADWTTRVLYNSGRVLIWLAAGLTATALASAAAVVVARALGG